jgi:hypothetical protein
LIAASSFIIYSIWLSMSIPSYGLPLTGGWVASAAGVLLGVLLLLPAGTGSAAALIVRDGAAGVAPPTEAAATAFPFTKNVCSNKHIDLVGML